MITITLKSIPDDLYQKLKEQAEANHRSINEEVIFALKLAVMRRPIKVDAVLERARQIRELTPYHNFTDEEITRFKNEGRE